jgi:diguanylate cyclase (GGDEF)-like protein
MPLSLIGYVLTVIASDLALIGWELARTPLRTGDISLFAALLACGAVCIEATRRLGQPSGVSRDLLSAWWLPVALLLPPIYVLIAPFALGLVLYFRVRRAPVYRRVFSAAALGLAGATASITFRWLRPAASAQANPNSWLSYSGTHSWLLAPGAASVAVACAVLFSILNTGIVAVAAHLAEPEGRWREVFWDRESLMLDLTEICVGILVMIACALSPLLLLVTLPPVILLQRSLMHQQLQAAARTDAKTGLLNATSWQREADSEIGRALRTGEPLALLLIDVDHFKRVNDSHGHLIGDDVLRGLAAELRQQVRDSDVVGRFGGEEFVVLLPHADTEVACQIAERLRMRAGMMNVFTEDAAISVTISIGVAVLRLHGKDLFELLAAADLALYWAKDAGRNQVRVFAPGRPNPRAPRSTGDGTIGTTEPAAS